MVNLSISFFNSLNFAAKISEICFVPEKKGKSFILFNTQITMIVFVEKRKEISSFSPCSTGKHTI